MPDTSVAVQQKTIKVVDLFCGAGGTSSGARKALAKLGLTLDLIAVNHWSTAIDTHSKNIPEARHYNINLDQAHPEKLVPGMRIDLLLASPECTNHSRAKGGKPVNDQSRASAYHITRWASALYIGAILIENVVEFRDWGPLDSRGRPIKKRKGETYQAFLNSLRGLGYTVTEKVLNAADFGDATTRKRLFIMCRRDGRKNRWPVPTHSKDGQSDLFGAGGQKWRSASEVIDWTIPGNSIFSRSKPLSSKTLRRIATGVAKFGGLMSDPYIRIIENLITGQNDTGEPIDLPAEFERFVTSGNPFLVTVNHGEKNGSVRPAASVAAPLNTVTGKRSIALCQPFLCPQFGEREGQTPRTHDIEKPLPTVTSHGAGALVTAEIRPVEPFILSRFGDRPSGGARVRSVRDPVTTVVGRGAGYLVQPTVRPAVTNGSGREEPTDAERAGRLVRIGTKLYMFDIRFRMLENIELARAMGFTDAETTYEFCGTKQDVTKQIGNAVPVNLAAALIKEMMSSHARPSARRSGKTLAKLRNGTAVPSLAA